MPTTALTVQNILGKYPGAPAANAADITFAAGDASNGNHFTCTGREVIFAKNDNASTARTITITSVDDNFNRRGDITAYSIPGDTGATIIMLGPFKTPGWRDGDGRITLSVSTTDVKLAIVRLVPLF